MPKQEKNTEYLVNLSRRLHGLAEDRHLSQADIGRALGAGPGKVGNWFQARNGPRGKDLVNLAKLLGVSVEFLAGETTEKPHGPVDERVEEDPAQYRYKAEEPTAGLRTKVRSMFEDLLTAAGDDVGRIGWIREQLLKHLQVPEHWNIHEQEIREVIKEETRRPRIPSRSQPSL